MPVPYEKSHLTYEDQVELLRSRGLTVPDRTAALRLLRAVGYYRLSAYVYPFRDMLPESAQRVASPTHYRAETIRAGTSLADVEALWQFDRKLRLLVLDAVEAVEIGLRTKVAYTLGARDRFGHVNPGALNEKACRELYWHDRRNDDSRHKVWLDQYDKLLADSKEDFVRHNAHKYEELPIWVGVEVLTFGALSRLFGLLRQEDQTLIARELGIKGGSLLASWIETVNYLRNVAAHHSRLWNRTTTYKMRGPKPGQVEPDLTHLTSGTPTDKVYSSLAVTAYLIRRIDPQSNWPRTLMTHMRKFPTSTGMSPEGEMGFPDGWDQLDLWRSP